MADEHKVPGVGWWSEVKMEMHSDMDYGVVDGAGGHTEFCSDGVCLELWFGNILEMMAKDCVPLHPPPSSRE